MSELCCLSPEQLVILSNIIALSLAEGRSTDELNVLGQLLTTAGDTISLIANQQDFLVQVCVNDPKKDKDSKND